MMVLTAEEVKSLVDRIGPSLGCGDHTYDPVFPEQRTDVCAIRRMAEDGYSYGFDTIYLVWKESDGKVKHREIKNSRRTKDYIHIDSILVNEDGTVTIKFGSGGSFSGTPWSKEARIKFRTGKEGG